MPQNTQISLQQLSNATDELTELADQLRQEYDCRHDTRIWADFENRIVSSELEKLFFNPVVAEGNSP